MEWLKETIGNTDELAKRVGDKLNRAFEWLADILESEAFQEADIIGKMIMLIEEGVPELTEKGVEIGKALGGAIGKGLWEVIQEDPWAAIVFGVLAGLFVPGPIQLKSCDSGIDHCGTLG